MRAAMHGLPVRVERGQRAKRIERRLREDVGVLARQPAPNLQGYVHGVT